MTKSTGVDPVTVADEVRKAHPGRADDEIIAALAERLASKTVAAGALAGNQLMERNDLFDLGQQLRSEAAKTLGRDAEVRRTTIYKIVHVLAENIGHGVLGGNEAENLHLYCLLMENVISLQIALNGLSLATLTGGKSASRNNDPIAHMVDCAVQNLLHLVLRRQNRLRKQGAGTASAASCELEVGRLLNPELSNDQAVAWIRKIKRRIRGDLKQGVYPGQRPSSDQDPPDDDLDAAIDRMVTMIKLHPPQQ